MMQTKRWTVTYTRHMKQKRKVYHDGLLELCVSGDKVMLYDDCEKLIDSRFLKHDEIVEDGSTLTFENHLVDVGELDRNHKSQTDPYVRGSEIKLQQRAVAQGEKRNTLQRIPQNYSNVTHSSIKVSSNTGVTSSGVHQSRSNGTDATRKEWNALYTTQITQKTKRYHDGILRLEVRSSHMNQVTLLSEDGTVLSSKHLKSGDNLETGNTCEFPNYLVQIVDPRVLQGDDLQKDPVKQTASPRGSTTKKFQIIKKDDPNNRLPHDDLHKFPLKQVASGSRTGMLPITKKDLDKGLSKQFTSSSSSRTKTSVITEEDDSNKTLPNACQISSVLKKLLREDSLGPKMPLKNYDSSHFIQLHSFSSSAIQVDAQHNSKMLDHNFPGIRYSERTLVENHEGDGQELSSEVSSQTLTSEMPCLNSKVSHDTLNSSATILINPDYEGNSSPLNSSTSSSQLYWAFAPNRSAGKSLMEFNGNKSVDITASERPCVLEASVCSLNGVHLKKSSFSDDGLSKEMDTNANDDVLFGNTSRCFSSGEQDRACSTNHVKFSAESTGTENRCESETTSSESLPANAVKDDEPPKDFELQRSSKDCTNADNFPTFDLGF